MSNIQDPRYERTDKRIIKTRLAIRTSFLKILKSKPLTEITIRELCDDALINRSTFYCHYRNPADVLEEIENELIHTAYPDLESSEALSPASLIFKMKIYQENKETLTALLMSDQAQHLSGKLFDLLHDNVISGWKRHYVDVSDELLEKAYLFCMNGSLALFNTWAISGFVEDPDIISHQILLFCEGTLNSLINDNLSDEGHRAC